MSPRFQSGISALVIGKSGDENDRNSIAGPLEGALHIETGGLRHLNVSNDAADIIELIGVEKLID